MQGWHCRHSSLLAAVKGRTLEEGALIEGASHFLAVSVRADVRGLGVAAAAAATVAAVLWCEGKLAATSRFYVPDVLSELAFSLFLLHIFV